MLAQFAVDASLDRQPRFGIHLVADQWPYGAEGVKALGPRPLAILLLQIACCDVVGDGVTAYEGALVIVGVKLVRAPSDDERQFTFKVDSLGDAGHDHFSARRQ